MSIGSEAWLVLHDDLKGLVSYPTVSAKSAQVMVGSRDTVIELIFLLNDIMYEYFMVATLMPDTAGDF